MGSGVRILLAHQLPLGPVLLHGARRIWALPASGRITMRKVDGWQTFAEKPDDHIIDLAA
jgi:hypothetical protein